MEGEDNMPTGYTAYIEDGKITTGKEFLKLCTRAMGVAVDLKEEPLSVSTPTSFEPKTYYKDNYDKALKKLEKVSNMSFEEAKSQMKKDYEKRTYDYKVRTEKEITINERYENVKKEVEEWIPPTENHRRLKEFALEQINMSINELRYIDGYLEKIKENFDDSDETVQNYINNLVARCKEDVKWNYKIWQEELESVRRKNEWMKQFLESFI